MSQNYSASQGVLQLLSALNNAPAEGTGIQEIVKQAKNLLGPEIPPVLVDYFISTQLNLFGDYPSKKDIAPSAIFTAIFALFIFAHLMVFLVNVSRGHYFYLSLAWMFYNFIGFIGWLFRALWSKDITSTRIGLAGSVFLVMTNIALVAFNLILAQRIFTWRHPVGGSRRLFWNIMFAFYGFVLALIAITILASVIPYIYFLSEKVFHRYIRCVQASAILIVLYSLTSVGLIGLSYLFAPTRKDENLYTYQPWWIKSFSPTYYVEHGAAQEAEETFMKRNHNHRHAVRVIAATHHHFNMVEGLTNERGDLKHNGSLAILSVTTLLIFVGSIGRCIAVFQARQRRYQSQACNPIFMYFCWGVFGVVINILYLVGRVDLRFYRPDRLPAKVRAIITAQQTVHASDIEDDDDDDEDDDEYVSSSESETNLKLDSISSPRISEDTEFRF